MLCASYSHYRLQLQLGNVPTLKIFYVLRIQINITIYLICHLKILSRESYWFRVSGK